jgi:hypothetical protein
VTIVTVRRISGISAPALSGSPQYPQRW